MFVQILFSLSALIIVAAVIAMIMTKDIIHSCIFLLATLIGVAGLYASMGADFVAVSQIMVYVGGVVILMLFAVMLTGGGNTISKTQSILGLIPGMGNKWSFSIALGVVAIVFLTFFKLFKGVFSSVAVNVAPNEPTIGKIGKLLVTDYILLFELSSVLLVGALVGAAIIARSKKS